MEEPISFKIISKHIYYIDQHIFSVESTYTQDEINTDYLRLCKHPAYKIANHKDKHLLKNMVIKPAEKPTTFPKFNAESNCKIYWNNRYRKCKIISIRWSGTEWTYQLKNLGHKYSYYSESKLSEFF